MFVAADPEGCQYFFRSKKNIKKKRGIQLSCLSRSIRLSHCPITQDKQCRCPRWRYIQSIYPNYGRGLLHYRGVIMKFAKFQTTADKAQYTSFYMFFLSSRPHTRRTGIGRRNDVAKIQIKNGTATQNRLPTNSRIIHEQFTIIHVKKYLDINYHELVINLCSLFFFSIVPAFLFSASLSKVHWTLPHQARQPSAFHTLFSKRGC